MSRWFDVRTTEGSQAFSEFLKTPRGGDGDGNADAIARQIVDDVRSNGASELVRLTEKLDRLSLVESSLKNPDIDIDELAEKCPSDVKTAIAFAGERIRSYHELQRPQDHAFIDTLEVGLGWKWSPLASVGLYVPGGRASYPSSVLMNAVPAKAAGVERLVMVAPAPGGVLNPAVAYAAKWIGVDEFYPIGGAQAIAALAYGAGPIMPVDKIVGPGNAFVAAAKRLVFGDVGIDTIAGPSEISVVADDTVPAHVLAADLLSQAEHDPLAQSILITADMNVAQAVEKELQLQLDTLATAQTARASWNDYGAIVLAETDQLADLVNMIAPEHVELAVKEPEPLVNQIKHAGAIFVGPWSPEALGDYVTGSNHVLPTSGAARFSSGLSTLDFMKRSSIQRISKSGFKALADAAEVLASAEGLPAHGRSVSVRRELLETDDE